MTTCPYCDRVKDLFNRINVPYVSFEMNNLKAGGPMFEAVRQKTGSVTVPQVFICGEFRGGFTDVAQLHNAGQLQEMINQCSKRLNY